MGRGCCPSPAMPPSLCAAPLRQPRLLLGQDPAVHRGNRGELGAWGRTQAPSARPAAQPQPRPAPGLPSQPLGRGAALVLRPGLLFFPFCLPLSPRPSQGLCCLEAPPASHSSAGNLRTSGPQSPVRRQPLLPFPSPLWLPELSTTAFSSYPLQPLPPKRSLQRIPLTTALPRSVAESHAPCVVLTGTAPSPG